MKSLLFAALALCAMVEPALADTSLGNEDWLYDVPRPGQRGGPSDWIPILGIAGFLGLLVWFSDRGGK